MPPQGVSASSVLRLRRRRGAENPGLESNVTTRLSTRTVTFARSFVLDEIERELPAGLYDVETEEESLEGLSFLAYRRVSTRILVRRASGETQMWTIHPDGLAIALAQDKAPSALITDAGSEPTQTPR